MTATIGPRRVAALCLLIVISLLATGCGQGRSVEAYCETLANETARLEQKYDERFRAAGDDPLAALFVGAGSLLEAQGDIATLVRKLAERAPEEVRIDHEAAAEALQAQIDQYRRMGQNPLALIAGSMMMAMANSGAVRVVDEFAFDNCGQRIFGL